MTYISIPACVRYFLLSDAHFYFAKTTYGTVRYLQVPMEYLKEQFSINVLWRDPLGLELGHCGCGRGELNKDRSIIIFNDLDMDRVHVQLHNKLGVNVELVERVVR